MSAEVQPAFTRLLMAPGDLPDVLSLFRRPDWFDYAACRDHDREAFYPTAGQSAKQAKAVCDQCPVRKVCASYAMSVETGDGGEHGIWGGLGPRERRDVRAGLLTLDQALEAARAEVRQEQKRAAERARAAPKVRKIIPAGCRRKT